MVAFALLRLLDIPPSSVQPCRVAEIVAARSSEKISRLSFTAELTRDICSLLPCSALPEQRKGVLEVAVLGLELRRPHEIAAVDEGPHETLLWADRDEKFEKTPRDQSSGYAVGRDHECGIRRELR